MTIGLEKALGLPSLADLIKEDASGKEPPTDANMETPDFIEAINTLPNAIAIIEGTDHAQSMDVVYEKALKYGEDVAEYAFQLDMTKSAQHFEAANNFLKTAILAKNSKQDARFNAMKLALMKERQDMQKKVAGGTGPGPTIEAEGVIYASRDDIIAQAILDRKKLASS